MFLIICLVIIISIFMFPIIKDYYDSNHKMWKNTGELKIYLSDIDIFYRVKDIVERAFQEWEQASDNLFKFTYVKTKEKADIVVYIYTNMPDVKWYEKHCGYSSSYHNEKYITKNKIVITLKDTLTNRTYNDDELYITLLHEIGHSLGLNHNKNKNAIMYYTNTGLNHITELDVAELKKKYGISQ